MKPFNLPITTFLAYVVIIISVVISLFWAWLDRRNDRSGGKKK